MRLTAYFKCALLALPLNLFAQLEGDALAIVSAINDCFFELDTMGFTLNSIESIAENIKNGESQFHGDIINLLSSRFTGLEQTVANNTSFITDRLRTLQTDIAYIRSHNAHIERALYESYDGTGYGTGRSIFQEVRYGFQSVTNLLMRNIQAMQPLTLLTNIYVNQLNLGDFNPNIQPARDYVNTIFSNPQSLNNIADVSYYMSGFPNGGNPALFLPMSYEGYTIYDFDGDLLTALETTFANLGNYAYEPAYGYAYYRLFGTYDLRRAIDGTATNMIDATLPDEDVSDAQIAKGKEVIKEQTGDDEPETYYQVDPIEETEDSTFMGYFDDLRRLGTDDSDYKSVSDELEDKIRDVSSSIDSILPSRRPGSRSDGSGLVIPYNIDLSGIFGSVQDLPPELGTLSGQIDLTVSPQDTQLFHYGFTLIGWAIKVSIFFYTGIQLFNYLAAGLAGQIAQEKEYRDALDEI